MTTNRQKSFIASLQLETHHVDFLSALHGTPALRTETLFSGGFYTGPPRTRDDSNLLGSQPRHLLSDTSTMKIYFRCTEDYYHLYIRSHTVNTGQCLSKDPAGFLGAFPAAGSDTTSFNILSLDNRIITPQNMTGNTQPVRIKARNAGHIGSIRRKGAPYNYIGEVDKDGLIFTLRIIERNAAYLSDPDEI